jgi:hypothetical protein
LEGGRQGNALTLLQFAVSESIRPFGFLLRPFQLRGINVKGSRQYVQDIFTIRPIAIKY